MKRHGLPGGRPPNGPQAVHGRIPGFRGAGRRRGRTGWLLLACLWFGGCGFFVKHQGEVIPVRAKAPLFSLPDQNGQAVSLRDVLDRGPALIVFYRGHW